MLSQPHQRLGQALVLIAQGLPAVGILRVDLQDRAQVSDSLFEMTASRGLLPLLRLEPAEVPERHSQVLPVIRHAGKLADQLAEQVSGLTPALLCLGQ